MEKFTKIPGLQRISEDIFELLDKKSLMDCRLVNSSWKNVLERPIFWLKKMNLENVPLDVQRSWENLAQELEDDSHPKKEFVLTLIKIYKRTERIAPIEIVSDLCLSNDAKIELEIRKKNASPNIKAEESDGTGRTPIFFAAIFGHFLDMCHSNLVKFMLENENPYSKADLMEIPWMDQPIGFVTPIHIAAFYGLTEVVKKIAKKYDSNPNLKAGGTGRTPIFFATVDGNLDIVKFLVDYIDDDKKILAADNDGFSPITMAVITSDLDILKVLVNCTDSPCAPDPRGMYPIITAVQTGHLPIVKYLVGLTDTPNAPLDPNSILTPIKIAKENRHFEVLKFLEDHIYDRGSSCYNLRPRKRQRYSK